MPTFSPISMSGSPQPRVTARVAPENLHPALWLASQLARVSGEAVDTGYPSLSAELPGGGWPLGGLIELLLPQAGIGELRLLRPALHSLAKRPIVLLQPPYMPQASAFEALGVPSAQLLWLRSVHGKDALWAAEQVLRSGSCGVLLFWQNQLRAEALRRLHLAAQAGNSLFCLLRPLAVAQDASPALLRLALRPAWLAKRVALRIDILKRRGPSAAAPIFLQLQACPGLLHYDATLDRTSPAASRTGSVLPTLVGASS